MTVRMPSPHLLHSAWRWLHGLMFVLVAALIVLAMVRQPGVPTYLAAASFTGCLIAWEWVRISHPKLSTWILVPVIATFAAFLWISVDAAFLAFPLFFAITHVHGGWRAVVEVAILTLTTVCILSVHTGWAIGSTLGPIIGATVALAVGLGFRLLIDARTEAATLAHEAGEQAERTRLAGDIHDTVAQGLSSIQLLLHSAEQRARNLGDPELIETLALARRTAADNLHETRRIIAALQPAPLVESSLPVALARVCSTTPMGSAIHFSIDGDATELPSPVETAILRATQSLLSNVVTHAQATGAKVTLTYLPAEVALDVVDNGSGFDASELRPGSFGLAGLRRRTSDLGGTVTIESTPGLGTGVQVRIPTGGRRG